MGTTKIEAEKTAAEITYVLRRSGARSIGMDYDQKGDITGLRFTLPVNGQDYGFALPVRIQTLLPHLRNDKAQARRVAWRQLLRWTEAQLAMIDIGMVKAEEVYTPYLLQHDGRTTLFEHMIESHFKQIEAPRT